MPDSGRRVFDDENDRWIEVREGETERDALLRARRDGAPGVIPPRRHTPAVAPWPPVRRARLGLNLIAAAGLVVGAGILIATQSGLEHSFHDEAQRSYIAGVAAGVFFLLVGTIAGMMSIVVVALSRDA